MTNWIQTQENGDKILQYFLHKTSRYSQKRHKKPKITHIMTSSDISQNPPPNVLRPQPEPSCAPQGPIRNKINGKV